MQIGDVIEEVIAQFSYANSEEEIAAPTPAEGNINWGPVDGRSLKRFTFTEDNFGIKPDYYEKYLDKQPYDFFKIFITDEI